MRSGRLLFLLPLARACSVPASLLEALSTAGADQRAFLPFSRRTRGTFSLWPTGCGFTISRFEIEAATSGQSDVLRWHAAESGTTDALRTTGYSLSASEVNATGGLFGVTLNVTLANEVSWASVGTLALWDPVANEPVATLTLQKLQPGAEQILAAQPTHFDSCLQLSPTVRLRWTVMPEVDGGSIELGLEGIVGPTAWLSFGPADPSATDRLMGGSDAFIAGLQADGLSGYATDVYMTTYEECWYQNSDARTVAGVCDDAAWVEGEGGADSFSANNVQLVFSERVAGVTLVRVRRPLSNAADPTHDHPIPAAAASYIWALGEAGASTADDAPTASRWRYHGPNHGELRGLALGHPSVQTYECRSFPPRTEALEASSGDAPDDHPIGGLVQQRLSGLLGALGPARIGPAGSPVTVWWRHLAPSPPSELAGGQPPEPRVRFGVHCALAGLAWCALASGEQMAGGYAWVAHAGGGVGAYDMHGLSEASVVSHESSALSEAEVVVMDDGLWFAFTVPRSHRIGLLSDAPSDAQSTSGPIPFNWAARANSDGPTADGELGYHGPTLRSGTATRIDLESGATSVDGIGALLLWHAIGMLVAWGLLAPLSALSARYVRAALPPGRAWLDWHMRLAIAASVVTLVAIGLAVARLQMSGAEAHAQSSHSKIGFILCGIVVLQVVGGLARPPKPSTTPLRRTVLVRSVWSWSHRLLGVSALGLGIACFVSGLHEIERHGLPQTERFLVPLGVWLGVCGLALVHLEVQLRMMRAKAINATKPTSMTTSTPSGAVPIDRIVSPSTITSEPATQLGFRLATALVCFATLATAALLAHAVLQGVANELPLSTPSAPRGPPPVAPPMPVVVGGGESGSGIDLCTAIPLSYVGDGFCDAHAPFNTAECGYDGGDCCDVTATLFDCLDPSNSHVGSSSPRGTYPAAVNPRYRADQWPGRQQTSEFVATTYNNAYEFTTSKTQVHIEAKEHEAFFAGPWEITIDGLVDNPLTIDVKDLIDMFHLEQRTYAHRCVEAWSIIVPWVGFPIAKLLELVQPQAGAKYVAFTSYNDRAQGNFPAPHAYPWPYHEGITIEEAANELAFLTVGMYQAPIPPQNGAPLRLTLPWKYGFKSIKFITRISFVAEQPSTFWEDINAHEYGFWANVNPEVAHRRWSQATERVLVDGYAGSRKDTQAYNGYAEQVAYLYSGLQQSVGAALYK